MPILCRQPELFPDDLFDRPELGRESTCCWRVIHTRPRQEKAISRRLTACGVAYYVPQIEKSYRSPGGRRRTSFVPMFPGYVFVYGGEEARLAALRTGSAARLLEVPDGAQLTRDLRQIRTLTNSGTLLVPEQRLEPGVPVRITSGPFQGFEGLMLQRRSGNRLLVAVDYLKRGVSVELGNSSVEKL